MKSFNDIKDFRSNKQVLFEDASELTGLPIELIKRLDETEQLDDFIRYGAEKYSTASADLADATKDFSDYLKEFMSKVGEASSDALHEIMYTMILNSSGGAWWNFFKIIMLLILTKKNVNYSNLNKKLAVDNKLESLVRQNRDLMESAQYDVTIGNVSKIKLEGFNVNSNLENDIAFYGSMRDMLQGMHKSWQNNNRAQNAYQSILDYINQEIDAISYQKNIYSVDSSNKELVYKQLLGGYLSPENKQPEILRQTITDIQGFVFDLVGLIAIWEEILREKNPTCADMISREKLVRFKNSQEMMLSELISSRFNSEIFENVDVKETQQFRTFSNSTIYSFGLRLNGKYESLLIGSSIPYNTVYDSIMIIKGFQNDFNLKIRKIINQYISDAINYCTALERMRQKLLALNLKR